MINMITEEEIQSTGWIESSSNETTVSFSWPNVPELALVYNKSCLLNNWRSGWINITCKQPDLTYTGPCPTLADLKYLMNLLNIREENGIIKDKESIAKLEGKIIDVTVLHEGDEWFAKYTDSDTSKIYLIPILETDGDRIEKLGIILKKYSSALHENLGCFKVINGYACFHEEADGYREDKKWK